MGFQCLCEGKIGWREARRKGEKGEEEGKMSGETEQGLAQNRRADTGRAGWAGSTASSAIGGANGRGRHEESGGETAGQR